MFIKKNYVYVFVGTGTCTNAPAGYQWKHGNVYYKKHNTVTNQLNAVLTCQGEGATLAMVKTQDALNAVTSYRSMCLSILSPCRKLWYFNIYI